MTKLNKLFSNKRGSSTPLIVAVVLFIIILSSATFEYMRLMIVAQGVRDAVQSAVIEVASNNWDRAYNGLREGYSGGFSLSGSSWNPNITTGDVFSRLEDNLGLRWNSGKYVKYSGEDLEYTVSGLTVNVINASFAPSSTSGIGQMTVEGTINVAVPLSFGWDHLPQMQMRMKLKAGFTPKF
jgi:hypothetical protein